MSSFFLPPNKLFHKEAATLNRIKNNPIFRRHFKQLVSDAEDYLLRISKPIQKKTLKEFNFKSLINDISLNGQLGTAHIGVLIKTENNDYAQLTYDIAICDNRKIIRKFHFDYTPENIKKRGSHPVFHLQYPGKLSVQLLSLKLEHDHLDAGLSRRATYTFYTNVSRLNNKLDFKRISRRGEPIKQSKIRLGVS